MSELAVHEMQCRELFDQPFTNIHEFLDQQYDPDKNPFTSNAHRALYHHFEGISEVCRAYGMTSLFGAVVHILEDCLGYIPRKSDYLDGTVDMYGRPNDQSKIDTKWFERLKVIYIPET
ncbi:MAG: hypothetical protein HW405_781 [Candidatus Berkelbacteria bacterium]|nr:hypothetical protein [Candidatus Berkelbacteria bacterium]